MLETEIKKHTAAVTELNATIQSKTPGAAPAATTAETQPPSPAPTEPAAAPAAAPAAMPLPGAEDAPPAPPEGYGYEPVDKKTMIDAFIKLAQDFGREIAAAILAKYGATMLPEVVSNEALWPAFYADIKAALEKAALEKAAK